jgi:hypothetical protein
MGNERPDTNDRVVDVLGELVADCSGNFLVALAIMAVGGGESLDVGDRLLVPDDDVAHVAHSTGCPFEPMPSRCKAGPSNATLADAVRRRQIGTHDRR